MANVSITINNPTLDVGESFKERHRLLPSGAWSGYTTRTNATFVLSLTEGQWEIEISLVQADGTVCPATTRTVNVIDPPDYSCPTFTVTQVSNPVRIKIEYSGGTGTPGCGYKVQYKSSSSSVYLTVNYATLPGSPFYISIPYTGQSVDVRIIADTCNGSNVCFDDTIPPPPQPACIGLGNFDYIITPIEGTFQGKKKFSITITFPASQSTIPTTSITANAAQTNVISPSTRWNASIPISGISPTTFSISFTLEFNISIGTVPAYYWTISFVDACKINHLLKVQYP